MKNLLSMMIFIFLLYGERSVGQQLFTTTSVQNAINKQSRSSTGKPGKNYWQNRADYKIKVNFDPGTQMLEGSETIAYFNNSPDTLQKLIIRLYADLYKKGVSRINKIPYEDLNDGVQIDLFKVGTEAISNFNDSGKAYHNNTNLIIFPDRPIFPRTKIDMAINWHYKVNTGTPIRTGMVDSAAYFIAYFFPRVAVYDDIDGWDDWSYNGLQEFYNDFGNFDVAVSVPKNYVVWATGKRLNAEDNFTSQVLDKIKVASTSDKIIHVIDSSDYEKNNVLKSDATGVWKFSADNITDFAFALSDHYLWDASSVLVDSASGKRTLASAAYNKVHKDYFDVADQAHQSVYYMSHFYPKYPFPFDYITVFDGTDQMEYPMMANDNPEEDRKDAVQLTSHEIFHSYFPFMMGTNETQYAWMDEGWASIGESLISPKLGEPEDEGIFCKGIYEQISGTNEDVPLITNTKLYDANTYRSNSYGKAALCYLVLQDLLGDQLYFKALHQYMNDWKGKHPIPYDFFYSINQASGRNLNWFWDKWFFDWTYPDLLVKKVQGLKSTTNITIENKGGLPLPVYLTIKTKDGKLAVVKHTCDVWKGDKKERIFTVNKPLASITEVTLGNEYIPDKNNNDNKWSVAGKKLY